eukprot:2977995-Ditylum_brightwellii.AAC.2
MQKQKGALWKAKLWVSRDGVARSVITISLLSSLGWIHRMIYDVGTVMGWRGQTGRKFGVQGVMGIGGHFESWLDILYHHWGVDSGIFLGVEDDT